MNKIGNERKYRFSGVTLKALSLSMNDIVKNRRS